MKPFILIITAFILFTGMSRISTGNWNLFFGGNLAMAIMLCYTALGHFLFPKGMAMMIPPVIPFKKPLVYLTGLTEIMFGIALLFPAPRASVGWVLILFFLLILPANIYGAIKHIDLEKGSSTGPGPEYLWFRIPLQLFFIAWVYFFSVH